MDLKLSKDTQNMEWSRQPTGSKANYDNYKKMLKLIKIPLCPVWDILIGWLNLFPTDWEHNLIAYTSSIVELTMTVCRHTVTSYMCVCGTDNSHILTCNLVSLGCTVSTPRDCNSRFRKFSRSSRNFGFLSDAGMATSLVGVKATCMFLSFPVHLSVSTWLTVKP